MASVRRQIVGVLSALLVAITGSVAARPGMAGPEAGRPARIEAFDVERVPSLAAGTRLNFSVFGSSGATVVVQIEGARRPLELREIERGVYDGSYVVEVDDRIAPDARVSATLSTGANSTRALLDERLLLDGDTATGGPAPASPREALPPPVLSASPPATKPLAPALPPPASPAGAPCTDCALVESIRRLEPTPARSAPGSPLVAALFGDQAASKLDRQFARLAEAIEGRPVRPPPTHEVVLRLPGGERLIRLYDYAPPFQSGETIRRGSGLGGARSERLVAP